MIPLVVRFKGNINNKIKFIAKKKFLRKRFK